jgi:hypothetical protein
MVTCCTITISNWIDVGGIVINAFLAFWIVRTIQNKLTNKRVLKDHFICEVKEIRLEYKNFLSDLYANKTIPSDIIPWFKLMNIKVSNLMELLNQIYGINKEKLYPYQNDLRELITENEDFIRCFNADKLELSDVSRKQFIQFQQNNYHLFNEVIIAINDKD